MEQNNSSDSPPVNILLVDDHPANLLALEGVLESPGHNLIRANSGEEALKWLLRNDCAVILLDVQMPVMDGYETAGLIHEREKSQHIPIIFVTAVNSDERSMQQGYAAGAVDYIVKPFGADILKSKVAVFVKLFQRNEEIKRQAAADRENERQLAEEQAYLSEFKSTLDATLDGVFMLDAQSLHFSYINYGGVGQLGYGREEILTLTPFDILPEADAAILREKLSELRDGTLPSYTFQTQQKRKDGSQVPVEVFMQFVAPGHGAGRFVAVARDITEHKLAQQALQKAHDELETRVAQRTSESVEARQMLEFVMNQIPQAVFWKDRHSVYLGANERMARDAGYSCAAEIIGKSDGDMAWANLADIYRADDAQVMETDTPKINIEEPLIKADGSRAWLRTNKVPLHDLHGNVFGILATYDDISAQKESEVELTHAREQADDANQAKSEFLSRMSHELRTPLNAILGFGQILDAGDLTPRQHENMGHILKGGHHLIGLINEVLDIARVEAGHSEFSIEPVALSEVVAECCALLRPLADERGIQLLDRVSVHRQTESGLPLGSLHVLADRQRLRQVVINLLSNAIKYNRLSGEVTVSLHQAANQQIRLEVQDGGIGLSCEDIAKLFTPFERLGAANSKIEGTGLGLVISQRLITAMSGTMGVESHVGQGSTFWIELPQAQCPAATSAEHAVPPTPTHHQGEHLYTVLSIEDNLSNIRLMEVIFESRPEITLLGAMQGSVGLDLARQHHPDVILLDLNLPGLSGSEVLEQLQGSADTREIPVIIISADATAKQIERLLAAGAMAYLIKPFDVSGFLHTIDETLHRHEAPQGRVLSKFEMESQKSLLVH